MKKRFTFLIAALMLLSFMTPSLAGWGQTSPYTYTFSSSQFTANDQTKTLGGVDWTLAGDGGYWGYNDTKGQQFGSGSKPYKSLSLTTTGISGNITSIVVNASTANDATATISCTVNGSALGTQAQSLTNSNAAYTFSGNASGTIVISMSQSTSKALYVKSLSVTYTTGPVTYTVTYDCDDATSGCPTENPSGLSSGDHITLANAPTKTHYTFGGWNDGTTTYAAGANYTVTSSVTMTAQWTVNTNTVTVTGATHGTVSGFMNPVAYNTVVTLSYTHNDGEYYSATFASTDVSIYGTDNNKFIMPDRNVTIMVTESALPVYTVTLSDGGTLTEAHYGAGVTLPNRTGDGTYTFAGWTTSNIATETTDAPTIIPTNVTYHPTENITLYPVYTRSEGSGTVWQKITGSFSTIGEGIYALITPDGHAFNGELSNGDGQVTSDAFSFDSNNESTTAPSGTFELTLTAVTENDVVVGYTMYNSTKKYLYAKAASKNNLAWHDTEDSYWKNYYNNWLYNSNSAYLRTYNNTIFRTYSGASNSAFNFVKKISNSTTYYISTLSSIAVPSFDPESQNFSTASLTVTITANDDCVINYTTDGSDPETSATATTTNSNSTTVTVTETTTIRALAVDGNDFSAEVSQTYTRVYEVTLNSNGVAAAPVEVVTGESTTLATPSNVPFGYSFRGWTATPATPSTFVDNTYTPNSNVTLYAVFGKNVYGDFEKVTMSQDDYSGYYLIVYDNTYALDSHYGNVNANTYGTYTDISEYYSLVNNTTHTIAYNETTAGLMVVAAKTTNGYSLYDTDGYLGDESSSTGTYLRWDSPFKAKQDEWTLGVNSIVNVKNTSNAIRWNNNSGSYRFAIYGTSNQQAIMLYKLKVNSLEGHYLQAYPSNTVATADITIAGTTIIESGAVLNMGTHNLINDNPANLIIEEGGQLIIPNDATVAATFRKEMPEAPADKDDVTVTGWKLISSPTTTPGQAYESFESVTNLTASGYLLYNYDEENRIWRSSQTTGHTYSTLNVGQGYLYGNSTGTAIEFTGNVNSAASYLVDLSYNEKDSDNLAGFNLIGNPFSHDIYKGVGGAINDSKLADGFYIIENGEAWTAKLGYDTPIKPGQGILVKATEGFKLTINNTTANATADKANHDNIMFKVENSECSDVAYALFDKGYGLNKISHRGDMVPMLYIPQNGENYAIAMMDDNTNSFNLGFEAKTTAKYTLTYKAKGEFNYLHVIDRMTGEDIDMLLEGEYSFVGSPQDDNNRFIVRLGYLPNYDDNGEDTFAYQNGSDIVVSGEGELQIFDVMGRKVASITINGVATVNIPTQGVYIMKLNEKTQKIVVR